jgi:A/G-specific adenine glycosylase
MAEPATPPQFDASHLSQVQPALLEWYAGEARDLPWRRTRDPYAILVSEVMLQQTQVERVIPKYREFLERFPTLEALAASSRADVIRAWSPLGYNLRAVRLHQIAQQAVEEYGGSLPADVECLLRLKGLGPYTAAAVACFAFAQQRATVDTNVRRVLARVFLGAEDGRALSPRQVLALAESVLPPTRAYEWNQALMDLGATTCTARRPACERCPLAETCAGRPKLRALSGNGAVREQRAAYRVTLKYERSSRYYRGRVVEFLRSLGDGETAELRVVGSAVKADFEEDDVKWILHVLRGLERDGLVTLVHDATAHAREVPLSTRVRLA